MNIMNHYRHLLRWIDRCNEIGQLNCCTKAIEAFERTHPKNAATQMLADDLHKLCRDKVNFIASIGLLCLEASQALTINH